MVLRLKYKYSILGTTLLMLILGIFMVFDVGHHQKQLTDEDRIKASLVTEVIKNGLITIMLEGRSNELKYFIESLVADDLGAVRLFDPRGKIIASSIPSDNELGEVDIDPDKRFEPKISIKNERGKSYYNILIPFYNEKPCQVCHKSGGEILSLLSVSIAMDKTLKRVRTMKNNAFFFYIVTLSALCAALGIITTIMVTRPLEKMRNAVRKVEGGDISVRFPIEGNDELGELGMSLNSMLKELKKMRHEVESNHIEEMQKVEKMATIGELAAAIAHEIKNPLAGISGAIEVFSEEFPPDDPRLEIIAEVQNEIQRLDKAVRDLLTFARPPKPHLTRTPVDTLIERAVSLVTKQAKKQNIKINILSLEQSPEVEVDLEQMQQVFLNILINAMHSMPGGGNLNITTCVRPEEHEAEVSFADTGLGISQENIKHIFKPFFTTKHTGTGLGLAISKKIMENHNGDIIVESKIGTGSNFRVIIPLEEQSA